MAGESLRDLVVSLSLDSDNFTRNIKSVNAQIKEAESAFRLAGAGVAGFENSLAGSAAKLDLVREKYSLQEKAVQQFSRAMQAAEGKLTASRSAYDKQAQAVEAAGQKVKEAAAEVQRADQRYLALSKELGNLSGETQKARLEWEQYKEALKDAKKELQDANSKLDRSAKSMQNSADAVTRANAAFNNAEAQLRELRREMLLLESGAYQVGQWFTKVGGDAAAMGKALNTAGQNMTRYVTTPILALGAASVKASIDFETAFTGVRKTVDATETQYRALSRSIMEMSGEVADSAENIAGVVATAGQLGIVNDELVSFTRTIQDLTVSTEDLKGTEAAEELAKFANIAQMSQDKVSNLGSTLTYLGNNYATTEGAIMSMALNIAASGKQAGLTEAQILGFAAGLSSVGIEAEKGGTAMSKALRMMEVAAVEGGQALTDFAQISGMTEERFRAVWESDPAGAFMAFINGLARMDDEGLSAIATMNEIGIAEARLSDTLLRTVNAQDLFANALTDANRAWEENSALTEEANKFYATTESRLKNLSSRAKNFATRIGDDLNPQVEGLMGMADSLLSSLEELDSAQVRTIARVAGWAAAIGPLTLGVGKLTLATGDASKGIGKFLKSIADINAQAKTTGASFLSVASSTLGFKAGVASLTVALIAGAAALAYYTSDVYKTKKALEGMQDTVNEWKSTQAQTLFGGAGMSYFGLDASAFKAMEDTTASMEEWRDGLIEVWTDGQKESDEVVRHWTESFKGMTQNTREQLEELKSETGGENSFVAADIDADIAKLDELDAEIAALIKKRQNGLFTEDDLAQLEQAMKDRDAIVIKYRLAEEDGKGYAQIVQGINDEIHRAAIEGRGVDFSVYEEGTLAAAQGYALITDELEKQYDVQRQILEAEGDEEALRELETWYLEERAKAAKEYLDVLKQTAAPTLASDDAQKAEQDLETLTGLLGEYNATSDKGEKTAIFEEIEKVMDALDKDALVEYLALIQQIQDAGGTAGMTQEEIDAAFGEGTSAAITNLGAILDYLNQLGEDSNLKSLKELLGGVLLDEVQTINVQLNRDDLADQIDAFEESPDAIITLTAFIAPTGMDKPKVDAFLKEHPVEVEGYVRLAGIYEDPDLALEDETARFFDKDGVEIPVSFVPDDAVTDETIAVIEEDGSRNILLDIEVKGADQLEMLQTDKFGVNVNVDAAGTKDALDKVREMTAAIENFYRGVSDEDALDTALKTFEEAPEALDATTVYVADVMSRLLKGEVVGTEELDALSEIVLLLQQITALNESGIDVGTGFLDAISEALNNAGWDTTAENVARQLYEAFQRQTGGYISDAGASMMHALAASLIRNSDPVIAAARQVGLQVAAALNPSQAGGASGAENPAQAASAGSYMGRVGAAMMESMGMGALKAAPEQARIIGNAARYISTEAGRAMMTGGVSMSRTYNQQQTVAISGNTFSVRSEQDLTQLAYEIAAIMGVRTGGYGG